MLIIGCDYHPGVQQIAFVDTDTGEVSERRGWDVTTASQSIFAETARARFRVDSFAPTSYNGHVR